MQHLSPERIAALVDEPVTLDERSHLEQCARCRADFVAVRRIVVAAASERDRPIAPLTSWPQLSAALRSEGAMSSGRADVVLMPPTEQRSDARGDLRADVRSIMSASSVTTPAHATSRGARGWQHVAGIAAAAALLVSAGVAGGRMTARGARSALENPSATARLQPAGPSAPTSLAAQFRTPDDARATLHSAEEVYSGALLWLAAHDSALAPSSANGAQVAASDYRQRLEVLDAAMATARRALYESPDDPVMNRYYLATLGAREVTLRRLTTVLPASQQVLEY
jgi:F0F1-type ATP synthase membrane subunit c/vacuolar-type H+-ATPase subunit K